MNNFKKWNIITGLIVFAIASLVYILTMEPTASLWDCAEFIATSYKLEVGHPPGAPLFMMIARFFAIFAPSTAHVAWMINLMSSLCGGFTILFLFWSITHLARRIYTRGGKQMSKGQMWTVLGAGVVGALAYCFTDTQWFSAVEAEVYSMSSMFTAMAVWAMLKWESVADQPHSNRWLVLIAYMMGMSLGIHILNLLTIPALALIYYFKKSETVTFKGIATVLLIAGAIILSIYSVIMPYTVRIGAFFDRITVNGLGFPINVGFTIYAFLLFALVAWGVYYTHKKGKRVANMIILCTGVILIGYSSYASVVIRSSVNPPMNSNHPDNPYALYSLLNRDQYGSRPLLYGQQYSAPAIDYDTRTDYYLNDQGDKYLKSTIWTGALYPNEFKTLFPRMWQSSKQGDYESWINIKGNRIPFNDELITVPTAGENLEFFFTYQMNFMYWRYFLWNFVGRQSDIPANGGLADGNWLSGIKPIDALYLGPQSNLPSSMTENKARNTYYFLPFILGIVGLIYQLNRDKRNFSVVMMLFLMLGLVLVLYFNTAPNEPRERDYIYAGSFYAFSIWIGFGVLAIRDMLLRLTKRDGVMIAVVATAVGCVVPTILVAQNWDDHNRSRRYVARDIGWNYLNSTLPNSIIMNFGDNDTFPIWYNQEVEEVRTDVKPMNLSYLGGSWYIDQMRVKSNEAAPVPFSLPRSKYYNTNEQIPVHSLFDDYIDIRLAINFIASEDPKSKVTIYNGEQIDFIPAEKLSIPVNKQNALKSGIVKLEDAELMVDTLYITITKEALTRDQMMFLDLLANFNWERPLYFTQVHALSAYKGLADYLQFDGYAYRLVPIKTPHTSVLDMGRIDVDYLYANIMEKFRYGNINDPRVYVDFFSINNFESTNARNAFARLAKELIKIGEKERAIEVLDRGVEMLPFSQLPYSLRTMPHIEAYYMAGEYEKGNDILIDWSEKLMAEATYFMQFEGDKLYAVLANIHEKLYYLERLYHVAYSFEQDEQADWIDEFFTMNDSFITKHNL